MAEPSSCSQVVVSPHSAHVSGIRGSEICQCSAGGIAVDGGVLRKATRSLRNKSERPNIEIGRARPIWQITQAQRYWLARWWP